MYKATICIINCLFFIALSLNGNSCPENKMDTFSINHSEIAEGSISSFSRIRSSGGFMKKDRSSIAICFSNVDGLNIESLSDNFVIPIEKKEQLILQIVFSMADKKIVPGVYKADKGYGKPGWVFAELKLFDGKKGATILLGTTKGTAQIIKITNKKICGSFHLKSDESNFESTEIKGTFNVIYKRSRW